MSYEFCIITKCIQIFLKHFEFGNETFKIIIIF